MNNQHAWHRSIRCHLSKSEMKRLNWKTTLCFFNLLNLRCEAGGKTANQSPKFKVQIQNVSKGYAN